MITVEELVSVLNEIQDYGKKLLDGSDGLVVAHISNDMVANYILDKINGISTNE